MIKNKLVGLIFVSFCLNFFSLEKSYGTENTTQTEAISLTDTMYTETFNEAKSYVNQLNEKTAQLISQLGPNDNQKKLDLVEARDYAIKLFIIKLNNFKEKQKSYIQKVALMGITVANTSDPEMPVLNANLKEAFQYFKKNNKFINNKNLPSKLMPPAPTNKEGKVAKIPENITNKTVVALKEKVVIKPNATAVKNLILTQKKINNNLKTNDLNNINKLKNL